MDLVKANFSKGTPWEFFYYRDNNQVEVDLILARGSESIPIEIKLSQSPNERMVSGIRSIGVLLGHKRAYLLNSRNDTMTLSQGEKAMHWYRFIREEGIL